MGKWYLLTPFSNVLCLLTFRLASILTSRTSDISLRYVHTHTFISLLGTNLLTPPRDPTGLTALSLTTSTNSSNTSTALYYISRLSTSAGPSIMLSQSLSNVSEKARTFISQWPDRSSRERPGLNVKTSFLSASERVGEDGNKDGGVRLWFVEGGYGRISRWSAERMGDESQPGEWRDDDVEDEV